MSSSRSSTDAGENLTDLGNAKRLVRFHGDDLRWVSGLGWLVWDGVRWRRDHDAARLRVYEAVQSIGDEALREDDYERRTKLRKHALNSEAHARLNAMLAAAEPLLRTELDAFDRDPYVFNTPSGTVDLRTGKLRPHDRLDLITRLAGVGYHADADAPRWEAFLRTIFAGDDELIAYVQRAVGYSFTGEISEHACFLPFGSGANGKTTFDEALLTVVGDYGMRLPAESLLEHRDAGVPNDIARLRGARLVVAAEASAGRPFAEARVKELTGGDRITARFMRGEFFEFLPQFTLWLATNHLPTVRGTDEGIWRRLRVIPFRVTIPEAERDPNLREKLLIEAPGILRWVVDGAREWARTGLGSCAAVHEATNGYRVEEDSLADFLTDRCRVAADAEVPVTDLFKAYERWAERNGSEPLSSKAFGTELTRRGFGSRRTNRGRLRTGLTLKREGRF